MKLFSKICIFALAATGFAANGAVPSGYYDKVEGKSGTYNILNALQQTVGSHTTVSYNGLLDLYKTSDVYPDGKIWDMYSTKHWTIGNTCGNYSNVGDCYNREHSMPKSWFSDASPMYSDAFHIYPTDGKVNGQRSNYPYGECANGKNLGSYNGVQALGKLGTSTFSGYSGTVFEPDDEYKGDFARSYFYMAAAYYDRNKSWDSDMLSGDNNVFTTWAINLLLKWHRQDPVSQKELDRNEVVYGKQHNRNPFIDHPELAEYIWGNKKGEAWSANISATPEFNSPLNGSTIDFGMTAVDYTITQTINVKGSNIKDNVTVSISPATDFAASVSTLTASAVNNGTASLVISYRSSTAKESSATLTLTSGSVSTKVYLIAEAVNGIPALPATDVDEHSFTARWQSLGNATNYMLYVYKDGQSIQGYPKTVTAATGRYSVTNLDPETTYTYKLSGGSLTSNTVTVTTLTPMPSVWVTNDDELFIECMPNEVSDPIEVFIDVENITSDISVSVQKPFSLSSGKDEWTQQITIAPEETRFYLRVEPTNPGEYNSSLVFRNEAYINDETDVYAMVIDTSAPWFVETFEVAADKGSYDNGSFTGSTGDWNVTDFGLWSSDVAHNGKYAGRFGKKSTSTITTAAPKRNGIGTVKFWAKRWSASDGDATFVVEYSADGNAFTPAGTVNVNSDNYTEYTLSVNAPGDNYLRIRQTAGARAMIDDLSVTDASSSVGGVMTDDYDMWDAYSQSRELVIESSFEQPRQFLVYTVDGKVVYSRMLGQGVYRVKLNPGLYLVGCDDTARKVLVR